MFMEWADAIEDPQLEDMYFDGLTGRMFLYTRLGDYPPEWVNVTPDIDTDKPIEGINYE